MPVKGFAFECEDDAVVFSDNCVDLVPGETVIIGVRGIERGEEEKLNVRFLN